VVRGITRRFSWAAAGRIGLVGWEMRRARAMGLSILCFTVTSGLAYFARSTEELLVYRFISCLGVEGCGPTACAGLRSLVGSLAPALAGLIGTAANGASRHGDRGHPVSHYQG
jgi:hypothetical protein